MSNTANSSLVLLNLDSTIHDISSTFALDIKLDIYQEVSSLDLPFDVSIQQLQSLNLIKIVEKAFNLKHNATRASYFLSAGADIKFTSYDFSKCVLIPISGSGEVYVDTGSNIVWQKADNDSIFLTDFCKDVLISPHCRSVNIDNNPCVDFVAIQVSESEWKSLANKYSKHHGKFNPSAIREYNSTPNPVVSPNSFKFDKMAKLKAIVKNETFTDLEFLNEFEVFQDMEEAPQSFEFLVRQLVSDQIPQELDNSNFSYKSSACIANVDKYVGIHSDQYGNCLCLCLKGKGSLFIYSNNNLVEIPYKKGDVLHFDDRDPHFVNTLKKSSFLVGNISNSITL